LAVGGGGHRNTCKLTVFTLVRLPRRRSDLYCVEWDFKLYYTIPFSLTIVRCETILGIV